MHPAISTLENIAGASAALPPHVPIIAIKHGARAYSWPTYCVTVTLTRLRENGRGVLAELLVESSFTSLPSPRLVQTTMNLSTLSSRQALAKELSKKTIEVPWDVLLEELASDAITSLRQGSPCVQLDDSLPTELPTSVISPLVYEGLPTILFGPGMSGKSTLALLAAMIYERGVTVAGLAATFPPDGRALYLDYEANETVLRNTRRRLQAGHSELTGAHPFYLHCSRPLADDLQVIARHIAQQHITFLVVDSLVLAAGGADVEKAESPQRFFAALRTLNCSSLIIGHCPKNTETPSIYGSVFFSNLGRSVWEARGDQDGNIMRTALIHRKTNLGALHRPLGFQAIHTTDQITIESFDPGSVPTLAESLPLKSRIKAALKGGAKTADELAEELGADLRQVRARLNEGAKGRGQWSVKMGDAWGLFERRS